MSDLTNENSNKALVTIGDVSLIGDLEPASYNNTTSTLFDSGTSVSGKVLGSVVRESVTNISLSWNYLKNDDWTKINNLFKTTNNDGSKFINKVSFFDQTTGKWRNDCKMYVSDRSAGMMRYDVSGNEIGWTGCSLDLMEV